ncbi:MAG: hypothetical protein CMC70_09600 [Flavobacteriaceae bacterium]|nr:hypothetical protein [Flavobacteriaceae bacterium]|tara:strand:- start:30 stop:413 length:384 start_codon:yes stop_codon:yes gene_type:complete
MNTKSPHKTIVLSFTTLTIYDNFLVSTIHEGKLFDTPQLEQLQEIFDIYFPAKNFGFIANRKYDYTVNPVCYTNTSAIDRMVGMAVLCYSDANYQTAKFTKPFFRKPLEAFFSFKECEDWINQLLLK